MSRHSGASGRSRGGGSESNNSQRNRQLKVVPLVSTPTSKHSEMDYFRMMEWMVFDMPTKIIQYYLNTEDDLLMMLLVYKGLRVRDIRSFFMSRTGYDIDFDMLQMKHGWPQFLLQCDLKIEFRLDEIKEEAYAFMSELAKTQIKSISHMQSMINCTPTDKSERLPLNLIEIAPSDVFMRGYLDCADGIPLPDPRVPSQDLGVAASKAKEEYIQEMKFKKGSMVGRGKKLSFEEQVAAAKKPLKPVIGFETVAPIEDAQPAGASGFFSKIMNKSQPLSDPERRDMFLSPKWDSSKY